jgi:hypothetical protein
MTIGRKLLLTIRRKVLLAAVLATSVFAALVVVVQVWPHPSDADLIAGFNRQRAKFERLREMIGEDKALFRVTTHGTLPEDAKIRRSRFVEYRKLLRELKFEGAVDISKDRGTITFTKSHRGFIVHGSHKGYVFTTQPAKAKLLGDLDPLSRSGFGVGWRRIEANWYLFFEGY